MSLLDHHPDVARSLRALRYHGPGVVLRDAVGGALLNAGAGSLHGRLPASLQDVQAAGGELHVDAVRAARAVCPDVSDHDVAALCAEHDELLAALEQRQAPWPTARDSWMADPARSLFIYLVARLRRPSTILDSGVCVGRAFFWLWALRRNGGGRLHTVGGGASERPPACGELRAHWRLHAADAARPERALTRLVRDVGPLDVFFHGADPSYLAQRFEYETAWPAMVAGGLLVGEHVHESHAFLDFADDFDLRPHVLVGAGGLTGAVVVR